ALASGEEIGAPIVLSTTDPATTLLGLIDPVWLDPELVHGARNIKFRACTAFVQFAVDRLPAGIDQAALASVVVFPAASTPWSAPTTPRSTAPFRQIRTSSYRRPQCAGHRLHRPESSSSRRASSTFHARRARAPGRWRDRTTLPIV